MRSRPGYLAPTDRKHAPPAGRCEGRRAARRAAANGYDTRARCAGPARGNLPVHALQAIGGRSSIARVVELDAATAKQPEWLSGGTLRLTSSPSGPRFIERPPQSQTLTIAVEPGQRASSFRASDAPLIRVDTRFARSMTARNGRLPIQVTTFCYCASGHGGSRTGGLRRGAARAPDSRTSPRLIRGFRRTERLRLEVPIAEAGFAGAGRLLTREGQATP